MTAEALNWTQPPSVTAGNDGVSYNMGTQFSLITGGSCTGLRWRVPDVYAPPTGGLHGFAIWDQGAGTKVAHVELDATSVPVGGFQDFLFATPVTLNSSTNYLAVVYTLVYVFRGSTPATDAIVSPSGNIVAGGSYLVLSAAGAASAPMPTSSFTASYFVGPIVDTGSSPSGATPTGLAVPVTLGTPTASLGLSGAPAGLAVPVALGTPATALLGASPTGLAVPVHLGTPGSRAPSAAGAGRPRVVTSTTGRRLTTQTRPARIDD